MQDSQVPWRFVLESFPQGVIVVPIEVMAQLILTVHGWKGKKEGEKSFLFTFDSLVQASECRTPIGQAR